jgi:hypothetical protein
MDIRTVAVNKMNPAVYNPRVQLQPGTPKYERLKQSIQEFGYVEPIIWNQRTGNIVGGHQRFNILVNEQGAKKIKVSVVDLDETQEKALNIRLNKQAGEWDDEKLAVLLMDLGDELADIEITGFDTEEVDELLEEMGLLGDLSEELDPDPGDDGSEGNYKQLNFSVRPNEKKLITDALNKAKFEHGIENDPDALIKICELFLNKSQEGNAGGEHSQNKPMCGSNDEGISRTH